MSENVSAADATISSQTPAENASERPTSGHPTAKQVTPEHLTSEQAASAQAASERPISAQVAPEQAISAQVAPEQAISGHPTSAQPSAEHPTLMQAPVKALDPDGFTIASAGTACFVIAALVFHFGGFSAGANLWRLYVALLGAILGAIALCVILIQKRRH